MSKPIRPCCVIHQLEMVPSGTGRLLEIKAGSIHGWRPYEIWSSDEYTCREGCQIIMGYGDNPLWAEYYDQPHPDWDIHVEILK